ncbi:MAG: PEP-CTERM sorting domain-containing protein [Gammaproteobacteria bacterium]|nr:PEP-CTERM sorting domain-containing protein [Gammaproteobacteria bacterium]
MQKENIIFGIIISVFSNLAYAGLISDYNLNNFDFEITEISGGTLQSNNVLAGGSLSGTSSGLNWSIADTNTWMTRTKTDNSFPFNGLPIKTDVFHPGRDFTIEFDNTVESLIVALSNDNTIDSINFQLDPSDYFGMSFSGTQAVLDNSSGGLVLFEGINSLTISHINNNAINDGFDVAFWAIPTSTVPEPSIIALFGAGLIGLGIARRKVNK